MYTPRHIYFDIHQIILWICFFVFIAEGIIFRDVIG